MKVAKQYLNTVLVVVMSFCVLISAQEDTITKQQAYGQALYERTCCIIDEDDSAVQKAADCLVQKVMADQEIYVLLNIGKKEGYTVAELLGYARKIAGEHEDQEVVDILQNVEQEMSKNWFSRHPIMTVMGAVAIAAGTVFAYIQKEFLTELFSDCLYKLGIKDDPVRRAAEQEAQRRAEEERLAEVERQRIQAERLVEEQEAQRRAEEQVEAERLLEIEKQIIQETERLAAEQEVQRKTKEQAEVERLAEIERQAKQDGENPEDVNQNDGKPEDTNQEGGNQDDGKPDGNPSDDANLKDENPEDENQSGENQGGENPEDVKSEDENPEGTNQDDGKPDENPSDDVVKEKKTEAIFQELEKIVNEEPADEQQMTKPEVIISEANEESEDITMQVLRSALSSSKKISVTPGNHKLTVTPKMKNSSTTSEDQSQSNSPSPEQIATEKSSDFFAQETSSSEEQSKESAITQEGSVNEKEQSQEFEAMGIGNEVVDNTQQPTEQNAEDKTDVSSNEDGSQVLPACGQQ